MLLKGINTNAVVPLDLLRFQEFPRYIGWFFGETLEKNVHSGVLTNSPKSTLPVSSCTVYSSIDQTWGAKYVVPVQLTLGLIILQHLLVTFTQIITNYNSIWGD